jgi:hypothetical protein
MPYTVSLDGLPSGYSLSAARAGERVQIQVTEFTSSEDGDLFIGRLDGLPTELLGKIPSERRPRPSAIDHLLAIVHRDQTAKIYVNELSIICRVRAKRGGIRAGDPLFEDDIADIEELRFEGVDVPPATGIVFLFSVGWRKGLFFDLRPLHGTPPGDRDFDVHRALGRSYAYLCWQHLFKLDDGDWKALLTQSWFPFAALKGAIVREMIAYAREGWQVDDLLGRITSEIRTLLPMFKERWSNSPILRDHVPVLESAARHFEEKDYLSCIALLYPRIEGVMRTHHVMSGDPKPATAKRLAEVSTGALSGSTLELSPLVPEKFRDFLNTIFFAQFDAARPDGLSRHTVAHGVAPIEAFSEKASVLGLLILDHLLYLLPVSK